MLQLDYFDDAIGQVEGLTILVYVMRQGNALSMIVDEGTDLPDPDRLRGRVMDQAMSEALRGKAGKRQLKNIVTGLLHMDNSLRTLDNPLRMTLDNSLDMTLDPSRYRDDDSGPLRLSHHSLEPVQFP
jgi:hypothetical protein